MSCLGICVGGALVLGSVLGSVLGFVLGGLVGVVVKDARPLFCTTSGGDELDSAVFTRLSRQFGTNAGFAYRDGCW